jgi:VanZ family protein
MHASTARFAAYSSLVLTLAVLLTPGSIVELLVQWAYQYWPFPSSNLISGGMSVDKYIHAGLFALCGTFIVRGWRSEVKHWYVILVLMICYGGLTELLQLFIPGRGASFGDLAADSVGATLGILWAWYRWAHGDVE